MANLSRTSMYDASFRADSMKVKNMMMFYGNKKGLVYSLSAYKQGEKGKYPGGYVFPPIKGLNTEDPLVGLDFESLYPSLIRTYNISFEKVVKDKEYAEELQRRGFNLHHMEFQFNGKLIQGWVVRHEMDPEKMGVIPLILGELFDKRKELKKILNPAADLLENIGKYDNLDKLKEFYASMCTNKEHPIAPNAKEIFDAVIYDPNLSFDDIKSKIQLIYDDVNVKQLALKRFMNTFYGVMGTPAFPLYDPMLAGMITLSGQYNIKMAEAFAKNRGCSVKYGDTDSIYASPPRGLFWVVKNKYKEEKMTRDEYWTAKVILTRGFMTDLLNQINIMLRADNHCPYLRMAYEEVLFPSILMGKKKYCGTAHMGDVSFKTDRPFVKGLEYIKQGASPILKQNSLEIIREALDINNERSLRDIVETKIKKIYETDWPERYFIRTATFKPHKNNVPVQRFVARMKSAVSNDPACAPPEPGEKFQFVMIERLQEFAVSGKRIELKNGDKMEYPNVAKKNGLKIDLDHYMTGSIVGAFARFISYHPDFLLGEDGKELEDAENVKRATRHLTNFIKSFQQKEDYVKIGRAYRKIYNSSVKEKNRLIEKSFGISGVVMKKLSVTEGTDMDTFMKKVTSFASEISKSLNYGDKFLKKYEQHIRLTGGKFDIFMLNEYVVSKRKGTIINDRLKFLKISESKLIPQIRELGQKVLEVSKEFDTRFTEWILKKRKGIESDLIMPDIDKNNIEKFYEAFSRLTSIFRCWDELQSLSAAIVAKRNKGCKEMPKNMHWTQAPTLAYKI
jgi:hypothetical protein